ncbi:hypothetical protein [uncultured Roseobacter sp.]|uniref:hypothetical protein n=1 Tax=uncultured Roseobacter sp. TaxID=114847 RepID=UPI00261741B4|nr:hypothetical protein [uncultured Roseobacter sp.]
MTPEVRLHLFFATENDSALILLRARRRLFRLISWDRATDTFQDGQWLRRQVLPEQSDLSPDGSHFIYGVYDGRYQQPAGEAYTVVSRPPWFTALALYPAGVSWSVGGYFLSNTLYRLPWADGACDIIGRADGLQRVVSGKVTKDCKTGLRLENGKAAPLPRDIRVALLDGKPPADPGYLDRYDTMNGCLHRILPGGDLELIRDFREMEFEPMRAPYDDRPEGDGPDTDGSWHPLQKDEP